MFNFIKAAQQYFAPQEIDGKVYVHGGKVQKLIRKLDAIENKASLPDITIALNLNHRIVGKGKNKPTIADTTASNGYDKNRHLVYFDYEQLLALEGIVDVIRRAYADDPNCLDAIEEELGEDVKVEVPPIVFDSDDVTQATMFYYQDKECPILRIKEGEKFRDGDIVFAIEIRGERSPKKILFKVEDIAAMFEMNKLIDILFDKDAYVEDEHYAVLSTQIRLPTFSGKMIPQDSSSEQKSGDRSNKNQRTFLTWRGLLKVLFSSRSGNALRYRMTDWVVETMFVHQFGSQEERSALARDLTKAYKACLNSKAGVYLVRIAKVKHLRESMNISLEKYPLEFDSAYVYKFGLSDDVIRRFSEHSARGGYGCYSAKLSLDMIAFIPANRIQEAENALKAFFGEHAMRFEFTDKSGKRHDELVILQAGHDRNVTRDKYQELIAMYPSSDNDLAQRMISAQKDCELQIAKLHLVISEKDRSIDAERHAKQLLEKDLALVTSEFTLKLRISELELAAAKQ